MTISGDGILIQRISWPRLAWLVIALVMLWHLLYVSCSPTNRNYIIGSDGGGYYAYLPALFIYHDMEYKFTQPGQPTKLDYPGADHSLFMNRTVEGKLINKYFIGTAVLEMPFFLTAYATASWFGHHANGYSFPFQVAIALSTIFYTLLGLEQVRRLLHKKGIKEHIQAIVLLLLFFGTNLYHYALSEPSMSHGYSFCMVALFLNQAHDVFHSANRRAIAWSIIALSFVIMIRPVNGFILFATPFIAGSWEDFKRGIRFTFSNLKMVFIGSGVLAVLVFLQLLMYKLTVGTWVADSYSGEHIDLTNVHFHKVLFSWRKGWFIYTPLMLIAVAGIAFLRNNFERITFLLALLMIIWVIASWQLWTYGGSLGMRPMIDHYALMAIPLAFLMQRVLRRWLLIPVVPVLGFLVVLNLVQHYQYRWGILAYDEMTKERYEKIFFKTDIGYMCIYDPGTMRMHTIPGYAVKYSSFIRTFEEDTTYGRISFWSITNEKAFSGKNSVKLDTMNTTAGLLIKLADAVPDSLYPRTWVRIKAKVFLVDDRLSQKMAISFRSEGKEYNLQSEPLYFDVDEIGSWQDYSFDIKLPIPPGPDAEACVFLLHDDQSVAYADNIELEFWVEQ